MLHAFNKTRRRLNIGRLSRLRASNAKIKRSIHGRENYQDPASWRHNGSSSMQGFNALVKTRSIQDSVCMYKILDLSKLFSIVSANTPFVLGQAPHFDASVILLRQYSFMVLNVDSLSTGIHSNIHTWLVVRVFIIILCSETNLNM